MMTSDKLMETWKSVTDRMCEDPELIDKFEEDISAFCVNEIKRTGVTNWTTADISCLHLMIDAWVSWQ